MGKKYGLVLSTRKDTGGKKFKLVTNPKEKHK
jgi:hypothetical protein